MMKVCKVLWSTNRLEYLIPTLKSQRSMLDFTGCEVEGIFIDDMPKGRHDGTLFELVKSFGYTDIILRPENLGLPQTWRTTFELLKQKDCDYVYLSEDDVTFTQPIKMLDMIEIASNNPMFSQVCLTRQKWYEYEEETQALEDDIILGNYRGELSEAYFWSLSSIFRRDLVDINHTDIVGEKNLSEYVVAKSLQSLGMKTCKLKSFDGSNIVNHIGDYSVGKRAEPGDPRYDDFKMYDPETKYSSKNGRKWV